MKATLTLDRIMTVVVAALMLSLPVGPARGAERVALVIGNAAYEHTTSLRNPTNDATDVARALEALGFEVTEGLDLDKGAFESRLRAFSRAARGAEVTLFFYAGHGLQVDGENYLVPTDAKLADEVDLRLEAFELAAFLRHMRGGTNLVFLDACRDNPLAQSLARSMGPTRSSAIGRGLGRVETASGTLIAYATEPGNVADDGEGRNSPFTGALLARIETPGLSVHDLLATVTDAVVTGTGGRQQPWTHSSLRKPFYFKPVVSPVRAPSDDTDEAYAAAERIGTIAAFQAVVDEFPGSASAERASAQIARLAATKAPTRVELLFWESVKDSRHPMDIQAYLDLYPDGAYAVLARNRLKRREGAPAASAPPLPVTATTSTPAQSPASARVEAERLAAEREFWASVKASEDPAELQAYLDRYADGGYAVLARSRLKRLQEAAARTGGAQVAAAAQSGAAARQPEPAVAPPAQPTPQEVESSLGLGRKERRWVQAGLKSLAFGPGPLDGLFGGRTREAIRRYQAEKQFEVTGYLTEVEARTLAALGEEAATVQAEARREAARRADKEAFSSAKSQGTVEAYASYLEAYPKGVHAAEAQRLRVEAKRLERERAQRAPGRRIQDCPECPELVVVPAGSFTMGSPSNESGRYDDEGPMHQVTIAEPFAVGVHEVTFAQWDACRYAGECTHYPAAGNWGRGTRPVIDVSWEDAQEYVRWLSRKTGKQYRLLSESEWEYVARAGTTTRYTWGDAVGWRRANCDGCGSRWDDEWTAPVGSFSPNAFGLYDVHGNVTEWVEDCWHWNYAGAPRNGSVWTSGGDCSRRVLRGGSWLSPSPANVRAAIRSRLAPDNRFDYVGFRVARSFD